MISLNEYNISWVGGEDVVKIFAGSAVGAWNRFISWNPDWVDDEGDVYIIIHRMVNGKEVEGWECGNHKVTGEFFIARLEEEEIVQQVTWETKKSILTEAVYCMQTEESCKTLLECVYEGNYEDKGIPAGQEGWDLVDGWITEWESRLQSIVFELETLTNSMVDDNAKGDDFNTSIRIVVDVEIN